MGFVSLCRDISSGRGLHAMFPIWEYRFVRIIKQSTLAKFAAANPKAKPAIARWVKLVRAAGWASMNEIQTTVPGVVVLNGERARFEIAGGSFPLIVAFAFKHQIAFIKFTGTHAEYDKIDALTVAMY
ncbi:type II toxin-antitoxin system HigB family toxin [Bradyrhizobium sp. Bra64]|uniref:type II toxin-antitoxin system HigB family toxin n=1 Tax=Bradyrhizobium sp. Bra64 TaxID=2926009 RepID=UPI002118CA70|nr:type II toxin-antitoxin system HigB family toxin [Bradyrhizobium sp. Bra64]